MLGWCFRWWSHFTFDPCAGGILGRTVTHWKRTYFAKSRLNTNARYPDNTFNVSATSAESLHIFLPSLILQVLVAAVRSTLWRSYSPVRFSVQEQAKRIEVLEIWKFGQWSLPFAVIAPCEQLRAPWEQVPDPFVWNCDASPFVPQCDYFNIDSPRSAFAAPGTFSLEVPLLHQTPRSAIAAQSFASHDCPIHSYASCSVAVDQFEFNSVSAPDDVHCDVWLHCEEKCSLCLSDLIPAPVINQERFITSMGKLNSSLNGGLYVASSSDFVAPALQSPAAWSAAPLCPAAASPEASVAFSIGMPSDCGDSNGKLSDVASQVSVDVCALSLLYVQHLSASEFRLFMPLYVRQRKAQSPQYANASRWEMRQTRNQWCLHMLLLSRSRGF